MDYLSAAEAANAVPQEAIDLRELNEAITSIYLIRYVRQNTLDEDLALAAHKICVLIADAYVFVVNEAIRRYAK